MELELSQLGQIIKRILCNVTFSDLKVQMRTGDTSGAADLSDYLSLSYPLALPGQVFTVVCVDRYKSPAVPDYYEIAIVGSEFPWGLKYRLRHGMSCRACRTLRLFSP
jgi:hypothetical protein